MKVARLLLPLLLLVGLAVPSEGAAPLEGVDVSKYQHDTGQPIDWGAVKRSGQRFAFIKATGGSNRVDPWFAREWAAAGRAGMIRGAYHYADPSSSPEAQAELVVRTVGSTREANNLGIVLDLEDDGGLAPAALASWAHRFLDRVEARTGRTPILYTYVYFWQHAMAGNRSFGAYPLWLARYADKPPAPVAGWSRWTFWQYSSSGRVPGIVGTVDRNRMCCSLGTLQALADGRSRAIAQLWRKLGGAEGKLGLPLGPEVRVDGGWSQVFERGYVASTKRYGTHAVLAPLWDGYKSARTRLGVPTGPAKVVAPGATQQLFVNGRVLHSKATGAHSLGGALEDRWVKDGGIRSQEGLPVAEPVSGHQQFVGGGLYTTTGGVRMVPGAIRDRYEELGGPASPLGLPTSDAQTLSETARVVFFELGQLVELNVLGNRVVI